MSDKPLKIVTLLGSLKSRSTGFLAYLISRWQVNLSPSRPALWAPLAALGVSITYVRFWCSWTAKS